MFLSKVAKGYYDDRREDFWNRRINVELLYEKFDENVIQKYAGDH